MFFALVGLFGLILNCSRCPSSTSSSSSDFHFPRCTRSSNRSSDSDDGFAVIVIIVIIFAILGIVYAFSAATIAVQRILQRHYHILAKKELTKVDCLESLMYAQNFIRASSFCSQLTPFGVQEYVVEDLRGGYTAPRMDPEHEQRLKMLQLI